MPAKMDPLDDPSSQATNHSIRKARKASAQLCFIGLICFGLFEARSHATGEKIAPGQ